MSRFFEVLPLYYIFRGYGTAIKLSVVLVTKNRTSLDVNVCPYSKKVSKLDVPQHDSILVISMYLHDRQHMLENRTVGYPTFLPIFAR